MIHQMPYPRDEPLGVRKGCLLAKSHPTISHKVKSQELARITIPGEGESQSFLTKQKKGEMGSGEVKN